MSDRLIAGWREWVALPEWGIKLLQAKVDTGARTSALHVEQIEELPGDRVRFEVIHRERPRRRVRWVEAELVRLSSVKPSHGRQQERPVVRTEIRLGSVARQVEISLVSRARMQCRMLVGRTALQGLLVDPSQTHILTPRLRREAKDMFT